MRKLLVVFFLLVPVMGTSFAQGSPAIPLGNLSIRIGRAQSELWLSGRPDNPYIPYLVEGYGRVAYVNDVQSFAFVGQDQFGGGGTQYLALGPWNGRGSWIESLIQTAGPNGFWAIFHEERWDSACPNGGVHKFMGIAFGTSPLSFTPMSVVIDNSSACGEGDGTVIHAPDGYYYMYLNRASDGQEIAARMDPANPEVWMKYYCSDSGKAGSPDCGFIGVGVSDEETPIQVNPYLFWLGGGAASSWKGEFLLTGGNNGNREPWTVTGSGIPLLVSTDGIEFNPVPDAILPRVPDDSDNIFYPSLIDSTQAEGNQLVDGGNLLLFYTYSTAGVVPSGSATRYLVARTFSMKIEDVPVWPNVGIELSRYSSQFGGEWETTILPTPVGDWQYVGSLGYLMTRDAKLEGKEEIPLYDCVSSDGEHSVDTAECNGGIFLGYAFKNTQEGTSPIYECALPAGGTVFDAVPNCIVSRGSPTGTVIYLLSPPKREEGIPPIGQPDPHRERLKPGEGPLAGGLKAH